ncbi:MAG: transposase [Ktedonobacteraceae bacterium]
MKIKPNAEAGKVQHSLQLGKGKIVKASFGERSQTKLGGAPLLLKLEMKLGLVRGASAYLRESRLPSQIKYSLYQLLWQRVLLICCGYEDVIDATILAHDPGLGLALLAGEDGKSMGPASQSTGCRFENRLSAANCYRLARWLLFAYIAEKKRAPKSIRLDFDGSCIPTYGQQEGSSFRAYYDTEMFFPLFVFDEDGMLITAILRAGEHGEAKMTLPVLKRLVAAFRSAWPSVQITVVMDAGFNDQKIYDWCEDQGKNNSADTVYYLIKLRNAGGDGSGLSSKSKDLAKLCKESFGSRFGAARYFIGKVKGKKKTAKTKTEVEKHIRQIKDKKERKEAWHEFSSRVVRRYGEFQHRTGKGGKDKKQWRCDRRVLVQCIDDDWGSRRTFWVTNITGEMPPVLINEVYSRRGNAELRIKDAKDFRCDKLSCQSFLANQSRLLMHVLAQRVMFAFRSLLPAAVKTMTLATVRERFICIPAIVEEKARYFELLWSSTFPYKMRMHALCQRLINEHNRHWLMKFSQFTKPLIIAALQAA